MLFTELIISGYLLYRQFVIISKTSNQATDVCKALLLGSCDAALKSGFLVLGLPWTAWGILYFTSLFALFLLAYFLKEGFEQEAFITSYLLILPALSISIFLLSMMFTDPFCGLCVFVHILNFALIYTLWRMYPISLKKLYTSTGNGFAYVFMGKSANPAADRMKTVTFLMLIFMLIAGYQRLTFEIKILRFYASQMAVSDNAENNFFAIKAVEIPINNLDASIGSKDAPVELVVFSDFECPYCADFAMECKKWLAAYPNKIRLVFKNYPLSNTCNPVMEQDMHPKACEAAKAAQAALMQKKFWDFHDALFSEGISEDNFMELSLRLNLDQHKFKKDRQSEAIAQKIRADINLGNQLGISGTPSVFLNKRKVENLSPELIRELIEKILQSKGK